MIDVELKILDARLGKEIPLPAQATPGSAGMDLRAALDTPLTLEPGASALIPTGIAIHIGNVNYSPDRDWVTNMDSCSEISSVSSMRIIKGR